MDKKEKKELKVSYHKIVEIMEKMDDIKDVMEHENVTLAMFKLGQLYERFDKMQDSLIKKCEEENIDIYGRLDEEEEE